MSALAVERSPSTSSSLQLSSGHRQSNNHRGQVTDLGFMHQLAPSYWIDSLFSSCLPVGCIQSHAVQMHLFGDIDTKNLAQLCNFLPLNQSKAIKKINLFVKQVDVIDDWFRLVILHGRSMGRRVIHFTREVDVFDCGADSRYFLDRDAGIITISSGSNRFLLLGPKGDKARFVRWILLDSHRAFEESRGSVALHAGALAYDDIGIILLGPSGAGKSTLLTGMLSCLPNCSFLCNDRIIVSRDVSHFVFSPLPVRLGLGGAASWERYVTYLIVNSEFDQNARVELARIQAFTKAGRGALAVSFGSNEKIALSPSQFCEIVGCESITSAKSGVIILPSIDLNTVCVQLHSVTSREILSLLCSECRTPIDNVWPEEWLEPRTDLTHSTTRATLASLAQLPAIKVCFGPQCLQEAVTDVACWLNDHKNP